MDWLIGVLQQGIRSLEYDIKCLSSELDGRKLVNSKKGDEFLFPAVCEYDDDDTLDLTMLKQQIWTKFDSED